MLTNIGTGVAVSVRLCGKSRLPEERALRQPGTMQAKPFKGMPAGKSRSVFRRIKKTTGTITTFK